MSGDQNIGDGGNKRSLHAFISGRVQGVNFRYYTRQQALELNLVGWVRNLPDGRVETAAFGDENALNAFERYLHIGPASASVTDVDVTHDVEYEEFDTFSVRYDSFSV